jgi:outer membrane lipoprotein-sorting protein
VNALLASLAVCASGPTAATTDPIDAILAPFQGIAGLEAHFREEKRLAMLAAPLVSEGEIYFVKPDRLARRVTQPAPSVMVIDGKSLTFRDEHGRETIAIDAYPAVRPFIDGFLQILAGNGETLHRIYDISLEPQPRGAWGLRLTPKAGPMREAIAAIDVTGRGVVLETLRVTEVDGDVTVTRFDAVDPKHHFTANELERLFSVDSP